MRSIKSKLRILLAIILLLVVLTYTLVEFVLPRGDDDEAHYAHGETELVVSNLTSAMITLYRAERSLAGASQLSLSGENRGWLKPGNYFLKITENDNIFYEPVPLTGYRCGPDDDGSFLVTIRPGPKEPPPRMLKDLPDFAYIPSGNFLLGDRQNPREPHYVWLTGYFIAPFEVSNAEFREFLEARDGYINDANWTESGKQWRGTNRSHASASLKSTDDNHKRFGQPDQPVTLVNWFEANAYCHWLTKKYGNAQWLFSLPTDAEWEKAARGPDNLDYALSMMISDNEVPLYNWKRNPDAPVKVVGIRDTPRLFQPNRYGLYHMTGNVVEWSQSVQRAYNREKPWSDDDRNYDETPGLRTARGGSWYSASIAYLYIPYRDAFQPEHSTQDLGFRVVAKRLP